MKNILTIDVEEWFHANYSEELSTFENENSTVRGNVELLLSILDEHDARATFFFLGSVAETDPKLVKEVQDHGHEIASHGFGHQLVYRQTREEFREDIARSLDVLSGITRQAIIGYRAPSWSINRSCGWAFEELVDHGIKYDSSIFPMRTFLYGDAQAPRFANTRSINRHQLIEIPPSTLQIAFRRIAFSGGFYFRFFPYWLIRLATKWINLLENQPVVFYLHPREIDPYQPRLRLSRRDQFIHYVNLHLTEAKLRKLLRDFQVTGIAENLDLDRLGVQPGMGTSASGK